VAVRLPTGRQLRLRDSQHNRQYCQILKYHGANVPYCIDWLYEPDHVGDCLWSAAECPRRPVDRGGFYANRA
jgi:hypothetical protein